MHFQHLEIIRGRDFSALNFSACSVRIVYRLGYVCGLDPTVKYKLPVSVVNRQVHCLRHAGPVLHHANLVIAVCKTGRDGDVDLVEPHEAACQSGVRERCGSRARRCGSAVGRTQLLRAPDRGGFL